MAQTTTSTQTITTTQNPLSVRNFRLLFVGESISILGDQFAIIALPWLVLQLTASSIALGSVLALMAIPRALFMLIGGVIVDRFSPRKVMIFSNTARMMLLGILTVLTLSGSIQLWMLFIFAFLFGMSDAFYYPAQNSLVPQILTEEQLQAGNSLIQGASQLSTLIGPALAGIVISIFTPGHVRNVLNMTGVGIAFLVDTLSFIGTIVTSWLISSNQVKKPTDEDTKVWESLKEGAQFIWKEENLRVLLIVVMVINFFVVGPFTVGIPVLASQYLTEGAAAYGVITACFGGGALIGIILASILPRVKSVSLGSLIMTLIGLQGVFLALMPLVPIMIFVAILALFIGLFNGYSNIVAFTWLQKKIPKELMGRVMSLVMFASLGLTPVSSFISGFVITINLQGLFIGAGIVTALFSFVVAQLPMTKTLTE